MLRKSRGTCAPPDVRRRGQSPRHAVGTVGKSLRGLVEVEAVSLKLKAIDKVDNRFLNEQGQGFLLREAEAAVVAAVNGDQRALEPSDLSVLQVVSFAISGGGQVVDQLLGDLGRVGLFQFLLGLGAIQAQRRDETVENGVALVNIAGFLRGLEDAAQFGRGEVDVRIAHQVVLPRVDIVLSAAFLCAVREVVKINERFLDLDGRADVLRLVLRGRSAKRDSHFGQVADLQGRSGRVGLSEEVLVNLVFVQGRPLVSVIPGASEDVLLFVAEGFGRSQLELGVEPVDLAGYRTVEGSQDTVLLDSEQLFASTDKDGEVGDGLGVLHGGILLFNFICASRHYSKHHKKPCLE